MAALPPATKSTQLFFHANKATCQAWLGQVGLLLLLLLLLLQVRPALLLLAYNSGEYGECVRQASHLLPALARRGELEQATPLLLTTALALARLGSAHGLAGLAAWSRERSGVRHRWVQPLIELVRGAGEQGARSMRAVLEQLQGEDDVRGKLEQELGRASAGLGEHQAYTEWMRSYRSSRGEEQEKGGQEQYLAMLSRFQEGVIPAGVEGLEVGGLGGGAPKVQNLLDSLQLHLLQVMPTPSPDTYPLTYYSFT